MSDLPRIELYRSMVLDVKCLISSHRLESLPDCTRYFASSTSLITVPYLKQIIAVNFVGLGQAINGGWLRLYGPSVITLEQSQINWKF